MNGADVGAAIIEAALHHTPGLLAELLRQLAGAEIEGDLSPLEGAPLPAFRRPDGAWLAATVVDQNDDDVRAGWPALVSLLSRHAGADGDLVVFTSSKDTARWAKKLQHRDGPLGTRLTMAPLVVHAGLDEAERLVVDASPAAALIAAWAVHRKDGPRSRRVLASALARLDELPDSRDRRWWLLATLRLLSGPQLAHIASMRSALPRSEAFAQFCTSLEAQAEARGKAAALLRLLDARSLPLSPDQRAFIARCHHLPTVDRWLDVAFATTEPGPVLTAIFEPADPPVLPDPTDPEAEMPAVDILTPDPSPVTLDPTSLPPAT